MSTDDNPNKLISYPITNLLKLERREELVPNLFFTKGVTTVATPSGGGKTTTFFSLGLDVLRGRWGTELIKQRPVWWIVAQDQTGLKAVLEAWMHHNPEAPMDGFRFLDRAIDFASPKETKNLIEHMQSHLQGKPPLIIADALSDVLAVEGLDEDKSKDVARVYKGVWQTVNALDASFGMMHHSGWDDRRERGSTAIRDNSDILIKIVNFDPAAGSAKLEHLKRRSGAGPRETFSLNVKLISAPGYAEPIPIVTGPKPEDVVRQEPVDADERNARKLVQIMVEHFAQGATFTDLHRHSNMGKTTFCSALKCAKGKGWIFGGGRRDERYNLQPDGSWNKSQQGSVRWFTPSRGVDQSEPINLSSNEPNSNRLRTDEPNASCKSDDATAKARSFNDTNEGESSPPTDLVAEALKHVADKKSRWR